MRIEDILDTYHARPFRSFQMNLSDGRAVEVEHPDFLLIGPSRRRVVVEDVDGRLEIIDPQLIVSLTVAIDGSGATSTPDGPTE